MLATNFGVFLVIYEMFSIKNLQYESNNNVTKYYGSVIPHNWEMSFEKLWVLPIVVARL